MNIPDYYRSFYRAYLRFAVVMTFAGLIMGILFQESSKKTPFSEVLTPGLHIETIFNLAMVHGHTFMLGVLIPMAVVLMVHMGLTLGFRPMPERTLRMATLLYLPASVLAVLLLLYKGYHFQLGVRAGQLDFAALSESYFFGMHWLRAAVYGISHTAMAVGLGWLMISYWKTMKPAPESIE